MTGTRRTVSDRAPEAAVFSGCSVLVGLVLVVGCSRGPSWGVGWRNPFGPDTADPADIQARYGPSSADRVEELEAIAQRAPEMTATQQQAVATQLVARLGQETDRILRRQLVRTIAAFRTPGTIEGLHVAMADSDIGVRIEACEGWRRVGGPAAIESLARALASDPNIDVRLAAARSLGEFSDPAAVGALTEALADSDPALQRRARLALREATREDVGNDVNAGRRFVQTDDGAGEVTSRGPASSVAEPPAGALRLR